MSENEATTAKEKSLFPLIRKYVSHKNLQNHAELILEYCDKLDEPLFVEGDKLIKYVLMSKEYYIKCGYDKLHPFPSDEEVAAALANDTKKNEIDSKLSDEQRNG